MNTVSTVAKVVLMLAVIAFLSYLVISKSNLETQVSQQSASIAALNAANDQCAADIKTNNEQMEAFHTALENSLAANQKAVAAASVTAQKKGVKAKAIMNQKATTNECADMQKLIDGIYIK